MIADVFNSWVAPGLGASAVIVLLGASFAIFKFAISTDQRQRATLVQQIAATDNQHRQELEGIREELRASRKNEQICTRRLNMIANACNEAGVKIPPEVWSIDA